MSMGAVSGLLREVVKDRRNPSKGASTFLYTAHLKALGTWHSHSPLSLRLRTPSSEDPRMVYSEANNRQKAGIVSTFPLLLLVDDFKLSACQVKYSIFVPRHYVRAIAACINSSVRAVAAIIRQEGVDDLCSSMVCGPAVV